MMDRQRHPILFLCDNLIMGVSIAKKWGVVATTVSVRDESIGTRIPRSLLQELQHQAVAY
jgi:hypothetical protein